MNINTNEPILDLPFPQGKFLETAKIVDMKAPMGEIPYLEMVETLIEDSDSPLLGFMNDEEKMSQVSLQVRKAKLEVQTYSIESSQNESANKDLAAFGINLDNEISRVLINEAHLQMEKQLIDKYRSLSSESDIALNRWQKFLKRTFKMKFPIWIEEKSNTPDLIVSSIVRRSNWIAINSRRGPANFCIVSSLIGSFLQDHPSFEFSGVFTDDTLVGPSIRLVGRIGGMKVFIDPSMKFNDTTILLGKETGENEPGIYFGQYSINYMKVMTEAMIQKHSLRPRYTIQEVGDSVKKNFLSFEIILGKKPFWRKLIGA